MRYYRILSKYLIGLLIIVIITAFSSSAKAQFFFPYAPYFVPPFYPMYSYYSLPPAIRTAGSFGYGTPFGTPWLTPTFIPPVPVVRTAAATVTLWLTVGTANSLLLYNPTSLLGASAAPVTPSPLFSLIAGTLIAPAGHSALSTTNPLFFNYLVNTYLLPTGLAYFAIP